MSVSDRKAPESQNLVYPPFHSLDVDESKRIISIETDGTRPNCEQ